MAPTVLLRSPAPCTPVLGRASSACSSTGRLAAPAAMPPHNTRAMSSRGTLSSWSDWRAAGRMEGAAGMLTAPSRAHTANAPGRKLVTMMGNKGSGGPFAPLVIVTRNIVGEKDFNQLRGKAISLHSQVIKDFCKQFGVDNKQVQGVIRLAKKNGEWLGFLA